VRWIALSDELDGRCFGASCSREPWRRMVWHRVVGTLQNMGRWGP